MRVVLAGADFEENLGLGMIAAVAAERGHAVSVVPFNEPERMDEVAGAILAERPEVVGLSIQFQHRAHEFLELSRRLRAMGYTGHVTAGGQFPTLAWREVLAERHGLDTVVLHEGERAFGELLDALETSEPISPIPGLALRADDGTPWRTEARRLLDDLDELPWARRYRPHSTHVGIPFIPIMGGRGCWGGCSYCAITSFYRDAREAAGGGRVLRQRSPEDVAGEMAVLWRAAGGAGVFCFHDDNLLLPRPADSLARMRAIRAELDRLGVGRVGIVGKCRPETLTDELAHELAELGVIRLYVGVENASARGAEHLRRGVQTAHVRQALAACREAGIFACYNLLVFEPWATLDDVRDNVQFMRQHAGHPVNFCRAEPYYGTPLHLELSALQDLGGSYLGWNYRIEDDDAELLFRVCAAAFRERNFAPDGVANRYMGVGYAASVLRRFYSDEDGRVGRLSTRAAELTRRISLETATFLEEAIDLVESIPRTDSDTLERETTLLGLAISDADRKWHPMLDELYADLNERARLGDEGREIVGPTLQLRRLAGSVALGASIAVAAAGCDGCGETVDPLPRDAGMTDAGRDGGLVADPLPADAGTDAGMVVDPPPADAGRDGGPVADPLPSDAGMASADPDDDGKPRLALIDQWRDSSAKSTVRSGDLPLFDPPAPSVVGRRDGDAIRAELRGVDPGAGLRWESEGELVEGDDPLVVRWLPRDPDDTLRVGVRTRGGVAVVSLRTRAVR